MHHDQELDLLRAHQAQLRAQLSLNWYSLTLTTSHFNRMKFVDLVKIIVRDGSLTQKLLVVILHVAHTLQNLAAFLEATKLGATLDGEHHLVHLRVGYTLGLQATQALLRGDLHH